MMRFEELIIGLLAVYGVYCVARDVVRVIHYYWRRRFPF